MRGILITNDVAAGAAVTVGSTEHSVLLPRAQSGGGGKQGGGGRAGASSATTSLSVSSSEVTHTTNSARLAMVAVTLMGVLGTVTLGWHGVQSALLTTTTTTMSGGGVAAVGLGDGYFGGDGGVGGGGDKGVGQGGDDDASSTSASSKQRADVLAEAAHAVGASVASSGDDATAAAATTTTTTATARGAACETNCPYNPARYAADPLFREFRVQPPPGSFSATEELDASFLIVSETNYAFTGLACNWLRSVVRLIGAEAAKKSVVMYVTGENQEGSKTVLAECGPMREVFLRDGDATSAATRWGSKEYFAGTMRKPTHLLEAFEFAAANGFKHMMFNDVDVAWRADLRKTAPRVDVFAAQAVEIGLPQVCSGVIIANVESGEARDIFTEWVAMTTRVLSEGTVQKEAEGGDGGGGTLLFDKHTYRGDEDVLNTLVLNSRDTLLHDPARKIAVEKKEREAKMRIRRHKYIILSPELAPNGRYARGADPKYAYEDASNPILVDKRYSDGAHFRQGASVIHVNWCVGVGTKMNHLKDYGLWFLNGEETRRLVNKVAKQPATTATTPATMTTPATTTAWTAASATAATTNTATKVSAADFAAAAAGVADAMSYYATKEAATAPMGQMGTGADEAGVVADDAEILKNLLVSTVLSDAEIESGALGLESDPLIAWRKTAVSSGAVSTHVDPNTLSSADEQWAHRPGGVAKQKFSVCVDNGLQYWDTVYTNNDQLHRLLAPGLCFDSVVTQGPECDAADVRIFSQKAVQWGFEEKVSAPSYDKPVGWETWFGNYYRGDGTYTFPPKQRPEEQVYFYFSHEAVGAWSYLDLGNPDTVSQVDYLALSGKPTLLDTEEEGSSEGKGGTDSGSAVWWSFGPTVEDLVRSYAWFVIPHGRRVAGVSYLAGDCNAFREEFLLKLSNKIPVHSIGSCQHNVDAVLPLPEKGTTETALSKDAVQKSLSPYMFHAAMENCDCAGYITEKVWMALIRGSIPVFKGTSDIYKFLPCPDGSCILDVAKFATAEDLAHRMHEIATNEEEWNKMRAWRFDPKSWSPGFLDLIANAQSDLKEGICRVLKRGGGTFPKAAAQTPEAMCQAPNWEVIDRMKKSATNSKWIPEPVGRFREPWKISRPSDDDTKWLG